MIQALGLGAAATVLGPMRARALPVAGSPRAVVTLALLDLGADRMDRAQGAQTWAAELAKRTAVATRTGAPPRIGASWHELRLYPLVMLCGQTATRTLQASEATALGRYLSAGGTLFIDALEPTLSARFDQSIRAMIAQIVPHTEASELAPIAGDHVLYRSFYALNGAVGRAAVGNPIEAVAQGSRLALIYNRCDLMGALLKNPTGAYALACEPGGEAQREQAIRLAINLAMYALCLDYKADQAHLPALLGRRRWRPQDGAGAVP